MVMGLRVVSVFLFLSLVSACAGTAPPADSAAAPASSPSEAGPDDVVLRAELLGGYNSAVEITTRLPRVSVYGDGRMFTEGPVAAIYPGPALPNLQVRQVPADEVTALVRKAVAAGVGSATDFGRPSVVDASDVRFMVKTADGVRETTVYALDIDHSDLTAAQNEARATLRTLLDELQQPAGRSDRYAASTVAVVSHPYTAPSELPVLPPVAWTGPALPGEPLGTFPSLGCMSLTGDAAKAALAAAEQAKSVTPWTSGGKTYYLKFRPLLPDEKGCADLAAKR